MSTSPAPTTTALAKVVPTPTEKYAAIEKYMAGKVDTFTAVLPKNLGLTPEKFMKMILYSTQRNPDLLDCTKQSLFLAAMQAADLGLPVGTGLAYLIPYKNKEKKVTEAQFQPDYKGLIAILLETGDVTRIDLESVYEKDELELVHGTDGSRLIHKPYWKGARGAAVAYYAIATLRGGGTKFLLMTRDEIEQVKKNYVQDGSPAWAKSYDEMAKKVVFKRLYKTMRRLSANDRAGRAIEHDDRAQAGEAPDFSDVIEAAGEVIETPTPKQVAEATAVAPVKTADRAREEVAAKAAAIEAKAAPAPVGA